MYIWIREGTAAKNLDDLLPLVTAANSERFAFATDDRHPWDLLTHGHLDHHVRRAIALGLDPVLALRLASWSCARHYGFADRGAVAPGFRADLLTFERLDDFRPDLVVLGGRRVAKGGRAARGRPGAPGWTKGPAFRVDGLRPDSRLRVAAPEGASLRVIEVQRGLPRDGRFDGAARSSRAARPSPDLSRDLLKLAVVERHRGTGNVGVAFARGFGLKRGADRLVGRARLAQRRRRRARTTRRWRRPSAASRRSAAASSSRTARRSLAEVALPVGRPDVERADGRRGRRRAARERGRARARRRRWTIRS